ncbi:MAG: hypothetical protein BWX50_00908 [Euryarchaeota archaeon ADurb.Bin009]|nr:MAG: hypothetical protein BWX50_00908 [Euryarchaeota archaeon ADurb.Bin009]
MMFGFSIDLRSRFSSERKSGMPTVLTGRMWRYSRRWGLALT